MMVLSVHPENFRRSGVFHRLTVRAKNSCECRRLQFEPDGVAPFLSYCSGSFDFEVGLWVLAY